MKGEGRYPRRAQKKVGFFQIPPATIYEKKRKGIMLLFFLHLSRFVCVTLFILINILLLLF